MASADRPDSELIGLFVRKHDHVAFAELVQRYAGLVYHAALRQTNGNSGMAEEVAQRVFILLTRKATGLLDYQALAGWMHRTTRFVAREVLRAERRRLAREQEALSMEQLDCAGARGNDAVDWAVIGPVIDEVLEELYPSEREPVLLRYFSNLPHAQVGARLAISENAARMRVDRALARLALALRQRGITSTTTALSVMLATQATAAIGAMPPNLALSVTTAALASGSGALAATVGTKAGISFMTAKSALWMGSAMALLAFSYSVYQYQEASRSRDEVDRLRREHAQWRESQKAIEKRNEELARRAVQAEARIDELQHENNPPFIINPPAETRNVGNEALDARVLRAKKLAKMKPLLEAGMPITGAMVVFVAGKAVQRPVQFVMGRETRIDCDDGSYLVTPALREDGNVAYSLILLKSNGIRGAEHRLTLPSIIQTPWEGFTLTGGEGRVMGFDPDQSGP